MQLEGEWMGSNERKQYSAECKREAVGLVTQYGYKLVEAARNLGIKRDLLRRWKRPILLEGAVVFPGNRN